jgi:hypothetical protein
MALPPLLISIVALRPAGAPEHPYYELGLEITAAARACRRWESDAVGSSLT